MKKLVEHISKFCFSFLDTILNIASIISKYIKVENKFEPSMKIITWFRNKANFKPTVGRF